jgi:phage baseplate assembly protein W
MHRPEFGCGIHDLVFEVGDATTAGSVERAVREALTSFEPRADVLDVRVGAPDDQPMTLVVEVDYLVRSTNNRFNLVYPFYLDAGPTA